MKKGIGVIVLLIGLGLLAVPFNVLTGSSNSPGDGGLNFVPLFQAVGAIAGALVAFLISWLLLKRRS
jgi:hypothetical protein